MNEGKAILSHVFGYDSFRPGQEKAVTALLAGRDVLAVMPTGAGKSICYQVPALVRKHVTIVISPLISLMMDQVSALRQNGVRAAFINSTLTPSQQHKALLNAHEGLYRIVYVAPERLLTDAFLSFACQTKLDFVIVDEAHCVSQWGQDFRPAYLSIAPFLDALPSRPPVGAFTATATVNVRSDIERLIGLRKPYQVLTGFNRPNLFFEVQRPDDRDQALLSFVQNHREESGIVYCATRKAAEHVAEMLRENGIEAGCYHAGMGDEERALVQERFVTDQLHVIAATNAFGMGIDKSNVTFVVHYQMPKDLESYYQEAGRAGRDGSEAHCLLLYKPQDVWLQRFFLDKQEENSELDTETRKAVRERAELRLREMTFYATRSGCLRECILRYFGESSKPCGYCGNCLGIAYKNAVDVEIAVKARKSADNGLRLDGTRRLTEEIGEPLLFNRLSDLRSRIAKEQKVPPFIIFTNVTLQDMVKKKPQSREEMLRIIGVGEGKMERYGEAFLREIAKWKEEQR